MGDGQLLDAAAHALGRHGGPGGRLLGQDAQELLAAVAVERVAGTSLLLELRRNHLKDLVARLVAVGVVVSLEVIDVEERQAVAVPVANRACLEQSQVLREGSPVAESGERVAQADRGQLVVQLLQLDPLVGELAMQGRDPGRGDQMGPELVASRAA